MTIGEKIKHLRLSQDVTLEELADAANTKKQTIHKYENGIIANIPASKIKLIADKLNTTPAYLMGWEDEEETTTPSEIDKEFYKLLSGMSESDKEWLFDLIKTVIDRK